MRTNEEISRFMEALNYLKQNRDVSVLPDLFTVFADEAHEINPLQSLLTYIETYDLNSVFRAVTTSAPHLLKDAPTWGDSIFLRLLNHEQGFTYLKDNFPTLPTTDKQAVRQILRAIPNKGYFTDIKRAALQQKVDVILSQHA